MDLAKHLRLVGGQVDDAVRDDDVDALVVHGQVLEEAGADLGHRAEARARGGRRRDVAHRRRHVDADDTARRTHAAGGEQQVHAAAAGVVEHRFAARDRTDAQRVADAREARRAFVRQQRELRGVVAQVFHRVAGPAMEVELAGRIARDALVGGEHLGAQPRDVEADRTGRGHDRSSSPSRRRVSRGSAPMPRRCARPARA